MEFTTATFEPGDCGELITFTYRGQQVTYGTIVRGGLCWLDRNLGADPMPFVPADDATGNTDTRLYGDLFQWGRLDDGHQDRTSSTTPGPVNQDVPGHGNFITVGSSPWDWRSPQNNALWQGADGINNPCPPGWRLPTEAELDAERQSWETNNSSGAYASTLKWPVGGYRYNHGTFHHVGSYGRVRSSSVSNANAWALNFDSGNAYMCGARNRARGMSVRCVSDIDTEASLPEVNTTAITNITETTATSGGEVTSDGGAEVTARGVVWSTAEEPTVEDHLGMSDDGQGLGVFESILEDLLPETTYYVRAYATNIEGTAYGDQLEFATEPEIELPEVTTAEVTDITETTATSGGEVTSDGGADVTARGVVWSTGQNPTVDNNVGMTADGTGTGSFVSNITGLSPETTYYVRAYATNIEGTAYGNQHSFFTESTVGIPGIVSKPKASFDFEIYPNPASGHFTIEISSNEKIGDVDMHLVNIYGQQVMHEHLHSGRTVFEKQIETGKLSPGVYMVKLVRKAETQHKTLIIK